METLTPVEREKQDTTKKVNPKGKSLWKRIEPFVTPNLSPPTTYLVPMYVAQFVIVIGLWSLSTAFYFPTPAEIIAAIPVLQRDFNLFGELMTSFGLAVKSAFTAAALGLVISYMVRIQAVRFLPTAISKFRFLSLMALTFIFLRLAPDADTAKWYILTFGMMVFYVTGMVSVIQNDIHAEDYNLPRTLRMNEWRVMYEVVILGKLNVAWDLIRQNFAIIWTMLTAVESLSQAGGGVGIMIFKQQKFLNFPSLFAIQLCFMTVGIVMDYFFVLMRGWLMPYTKLKTGK